MTADDSLDRDTDTHEPTIECIFGSIADELLQDLTVNVQRLVMR